MSVKGSVYCAVLLVSIWLISIVAHAKEQNSTKQFGLSLVDETTCIFFTIENSALRCVGKLLVDPKNPDEIRLTLGPNGSSYEFRLRDSRDLTVVELVEIQNLLSIFKNCTGPEFKCIHKRLTGYQDGFVQLERLKDFDFTEAEHKVYEFRLLGAASTSEATDLLLTYSSHGSSVFITYSSYLMPGLSAATEYFNFTTIDKD